VVIPLDSGGAVDDDEDVFRCRVVDGAGIDKLALASAAAGPGVFDPGTVGAGESTSNIERSTSNVQSERDALDVER
jgi:hypothetical protein